MNAWAEIAARETAAGNIKAAWIIASAGIIITGMIIAYKIYQQKSR
jgi:hypothetical protein